MKYPCWKHGQTQTRIADVAVVYPFNTYTSTPNSTFSNKIHKQDIDGVCLYRNHAGRVVHAETPYRAWSADVDDILEAVAS
ncbi:MAG: hypothetical protein AAF708_00385 [Deinococcota bacterium]